MSTSHHFHVQVAAARFSWEKFNVADGELTGPCAPYRKQPCKRARKPRSRTRTSQKSFRTGSSDDECEQTAPSASSK